MRWKTKALIQNSISALPFSEQVYGLVQGTVGRRRRVPDVITDLRLCSRLLQLVVQSGVKLAGARAMEIGTGWGLNMPMVLFVCQAQSIKTYDLHRLLNARMVLGQIAVIREQRREVREILLPVADEREVDRRLDALCQLKSLDELLDLASIEYYAPADATDTGLPDHSIDIQVSKTVMEHVPQEVIVRLLKESTRLLSAKGVVAHQIDTSDHFSHIDPTISPINFLQFSDAQWQKYGGNQFAYHNRLRMTEYKGMFEDNGYSLMQWRALCDARSVEALQRGLVLDAKFRKYSVDDLCARTIEWVGRPLS